MPISPNDFINYRPLSRKGKDAIRELADDVAELMSLLPQIRRKILEPERHMLYRASGAKVGGFLIDDAETTSIDTSPNRWRYKGRRCTIDDATGLAQSVVGNELVVLYNFAEDSSAYQHGQDMAPNGVTLTTYAVQGPVPAFYSGVNDEDGVPIWIFDVLNPTQPTCPE